MVSTEDVLGNFDPTDLKYQVTSEYKPDKESTWPFPAEKDGWMHAHNALRAAITSVRETLEIMKSRKDLLTSWQIKALTAATTAHFIDIDDHHHNEDEFVVPVLTKRFHYPQKFVADHDDLEEKIESVKKMILELKEGSTVDALLSLWIEYQDITFPHLRAEEIVALPLTRAYFTPEGFKPIIVKIMKNIPKVAQGAFIHSMGEERMRNEFMKQEGIPFFAWYIVFRSAVKLYEREFVENLNALKSGIEPKQSKFSILRFLRFF